MSKFKTIFFYCVSIAQIASAQDVNLSQFFNFSTSINPAFCGANTYSRVNVGYRNQWLGLNSGFNTSYVGFDHYWKPKYSGVGGFIKYDRTPSGYTNIQAQAQFAHIVQLTMKSALRAGIQIGVANNQFNISNLIMVDNLNNDGVVNSTTNDNVGNSKTYLDLGLGLLYYSEKYWLGASAYHLNRPNVGFGVNETQMPISWSVHAGARWFVGRERGIQREVRKTFSPAFLLRNTANLYQFDFSGIFNFQPLLLGFGYRGLPILRYEKLQNDAVMFLVGYKTPQILIAYSYDLPISSLGISTLGSHEISLVYEFGERAASARKGSRMITTPFPLLYSH